MFNLLHRCPRVGDPQQEGAGPGVDTRNAVAALPGPVAHDAQQMPGVADEEAPEAPLHASLSSSEILTA